MPVCRSVRIRETDRGWMVGSLHQPGIVLPSFDAAMELVEGCLADLGAPRIVIQQKRRPTLLTAS